MGMSGPRNSKMPSPLGLSVTASLTLCPDFGSMIALQSADSRLLGLF